MGIEVIGDYIPSWGSVGTIAVILSFGLAFAFVTYILLVWFILYKYEVRIKRSPTDELKDKGRLIKKNSVTWLKLLRAKEEIILPINAMIRSGRKRAIELYQDNAGDYRPIKLYEKAPHPEELSDNFIEETEEGIKVNLEEIFPHLKPDNIKVRQQHILKQKESVERWQKKKLWMEILPYAAVGLCAMINFIAFMAVLKYKCG